LAEVSSSQSFAEAVAERVITDYGCSRHGGVEQHK
jgi:hypothetical protein